MSLGMSSFQLHWISSKATKLATAHLFLGDLVKWAVHFYSELARKFVFFFFSWGHLWDESDPGELGETMTGGSLGIRSGSYGSLQQQALIQQQQQQQPPNGSLFLFAQSTPPRKPSKMPKEKFAQRIFKFAGRKKVGMLFICVISAAVFGCVLTVGKGQELFLYSIAFPFFSLETIALLEFGLVIWMLTG